MANHFSAIKRARQTTKRTNVNRANISKVRGHLRALREAIASGDKKAAEAQFQITVSAVDKAIRKGTLHKNTASRYKSRLQKHVNKLTAAKK